MYSLCRNELADSQKQLHTFYIYAFCDKSGRLNIWLCNSVEQLQLNDLEESK